jgi:ribosomal protein S18 acetylase RimI-like enzyme
VAITSRPASDTADLLAAGRLQSEAWLAVGPLVATTPGDLEWWYAQGHPAGLADLLRLWFDDDELVGWSWRSGLDELDWNVAPSHRASGVTDEVLAWAVGSASEPLKTWAAEYEPRRVRALERHGFRRTDERLTQWLRLLDDGRAIPTPDVPAGYSLRAVEGDDDVAARVEVHRQAFAPSRLTEEKYRRLMTLPHYRPEHDFVVVAPDGSFAAFTLAWWDPVGRVGELEPVGTHPHHRRLGLARATNLTAVQRLADLGARWVQVYSETANAAAESLYASAGFEVLAHHARYVRAAGG